MDDSPQPKRRGWVTGLCWAVAGLLLAWTITRVFGLERGVPLVQLMAYTPYVIPISVLALLVTALLRRWLPAGLILLVVIALGSMVLPRVIGGTEDASGGQPVRILSFNMAKSKANSKDLVELVAARDADLVVLQEVSPEKVGELDRRGLSATHPHQVLEVAPKSWGGGIWSRWPLRSLEPLKVRRQARAEVLTPSSRPIELIAVHTTAPIKADSTKDWEEDFRLFPAAGSGDHPIVMAGDFNATLDHANLRDLLGKGYRDAAEVTGNGLISTWPSRLRIPPRVTIDHVLAERGLPFSGYAVEKVRGSDHRAVFAELIVPPGSDPE